MSANCDKLPSSISGSLASQPRTVAASTPRRCPSSSTDMPRASRSSWIFFAFALANARSLPPADSSCPHSIAPRRGEAG